LLVANRSIILLLRPFFEVQLMTSPRGMLAARLVFLGYL
jgi:hypothetical protein